MDANSCSLISSPHSIAIVVASFPVLIPQLLLSCLLSVSAVAENVLHRIQDDRLVSEFMIQHKDPVLDPLHPGSLTKCLI